MSNGCSTLGSSLKFLINICWWQPERKQRPESSIVVANSHVSAGFAILNWSLSPSPSLFSLSLSTYLSIDLSSVLCFLWIFCLNCSCSALCWGSDLTYSACVCMLITVPCTPKFSASGSDGDQNTTLRVFSKGYGLSCVYMYIWHTHTFTHRHAHCGCCFVLVHSQASTVQRNSLKC